MTTLGFTAQLSHTDLLAAGHAARGADADALATALREVRALLRGHVTRLTADQLAPPWRPGINPPLWECAHTAWFGEWWCLRGAHIAADGRANATRASIWSEADATLDSNRIAHGDRWHLPSLTPAAVLDYVDTTTEAMLTALRSTPGDDESLYPFRLALFHDAMHLEAIAWCAQAFAWPPPTWVRPLQDLHRPGDIALPGGRMQLGHRGAGFSFDNEREGHEGALAAFAIDHTPVSNAQFAQFVESDEYRARTGFDHPIYWRAGPDGSWETRSFDAWRALDPRAPVIHVSALEVDAYCHWAGRRLPSEAEWEAAASAGAIEWGDSVWEWTATAFAPYPGFNTDRYREYSEPWFDGHHLVLRGGSHATLPLMHHARYRNFFTPERRELFAGFRTCSL